ncbi:MAG: EamA family transporter [Chloroflexota bacterium]|nr:EamA family transporter [Chloroflexota bacterium]
MTTLALILVLLGSVAHAGWNLLLKRSDNKEVFVWSLLVSGSLMLAPLGAVLFWLNPISPLGYWLVLATIVVHVYYFVLLGRGYARGDLSLVYPIARGVGPMLVPVLAVLTLGEQIAWPAVLGIVSIVLGIYVVSWWGRFREIMASPMSFFRDGGIRYALLTGLTITVYTLVDKRGVEHVQPILYMYLLTLGVAVGLAPYILRTHGWAPVVREWRSHTWPILVAGLLVFLAYGLALTAFSLSRVSYVAPAREVSIVIGVLAGVIILKEPFGRGRLLGSCLILVGLALIAISP